MGRVVLGALAALALALLAFVLARRARLPRDAHDRALAELQRALRRSGRAVPEGMTLIQLERRLGISGNPYLRALRTVRYAPRATQPTRADRAAFRRDLALGLGWRGRLLALWALPPAVTLRRPPR